MPPLPTAARLLLEVVARLVPRGLRNDWRAEWHGELHSHQQRLAPTGRATGLPLLRHSLGSLPDAFWIRTHEWSADMMRQDLRFALRTHLRRPGLAVVAIITLAFGIGANTALFSVVNALLIQPLPYPDADRLLRLYGTNTARGISFSNANPNDLLDLRERVDAIAGLAYAFGSSTTLTGAGDAQRWRIGVVDASYFDVLAVAPAQGRSFRSEENVEGADRVIVLAHATWVSTFGADTGIIGAEIVLDGEPHVVVGVTAPGYADPLEPFQAWKPWARDPNNRGGHFVRSVARMAPGVDLATTRAQIDAAFAAIAEEYGKGDRGINAISLHESIVGETRPLVLLLFGAVGFLLLIACANVASLMLARALNRHQEVAVRVALGAGRMRLLRQLFTESLLLAAAAGVLGLGMASALMVAAGRGADALPTPVPLAIDPRVATFCALVTLGTGLLFGLLPAVYATRGDVTGGLRGGRTETASARRGGLRATLVIAEVALSIVLLVGAGLMLRSLAELVAVDPGFDADDVLAFRLTVPASDYPETVEVPGFYEALMDRIRALPGVESVGAINRLPFSGSYSCDLFVLEGWPQPEPGRGECAEERVIAGDYFEVMRIPLATGRWLGPGDDADAAPVALVSRSMQERYIAEGAVGRGFKWGLHDERPFRRVIGVVEDVKHVDLRADSMTEVYMSHAQYPFYRTLFVVVRAPDPLSLVGPIRAQLGEIDPDIPIFAVASLRSLVDESVQGARIGAQLLSGFAAIAALVASIGLYGVLAFSVSQRAHEFGVRMALGAGRGDVIGMVLRQAVRMVAVGIVLGVLGALMLAGTLRGILYEVSPQDPATIAAVVVGLLAIAIAAAGVPALRATRVDPVKSLREA